MLLTFFVSGAIGFPMKWTGAFPHLEDAYYKPLGPVRAFQTDGMSGLIVQSVVIAFIYLFE
jgi:hypothetical protein